jgi:predicted lipid-binding transport protein (Tim44 family)
MKSRMLALCAVSILSLALLSDAAFAKRMGSGGSFGSRGSYSRSYTPPAGSGFSPSSPATPTRQMGQQSAQPTPAQPPYQPQSNGGMFGRMGWGLGGFMAGGLLGSMLFGHGFGGGFGGGSGGIGLLDILLLGIIVYFGYRLLRGARPAATAPRDPGNRPDEQAFRRGGDSRSQAENSWDRLRQDDDRQPPLREGAPGATGGFGVAPGNEAPAQPSVPDGFSIPDFLEGAKSVYARLQHSWDRRDLSDIALFTTAEVLAELRRQAALDPDQSKTELLLVNARLLEFREEAPDTVATVLFDVLMRESADEQRPKQVREVWHFSRPTKDLAANWRLEGIQQLED